jgi:DNA-binding winged helix-turn-helix (wHTH) protein
MSHPIFACAMNANFHQSIPAGDATLLRFGPFVLDVRQRRLERDGVAAEIRPKQFDALQLLIVHAGDLVTREQFHAALWPNTVVSETSLSKYIWQLRHILGDNDENGNYIETVPKLGYRFIAPVQRLVPVEIIETNLDNAASRDAPLEHHAQSAAYGLRRANGAPWLIAAVAAIVLALITWQLWPPRETIPQTAKRADAPLPTTTHRRAIAIMEAQLDADMPQWLHSAVAQLLAQDLAISEQLRVAYPNALMLRYPDLMAQAQAAEPAGARLTDWASINDDILLLPTLTHNGDNASANAVKLQVRLLDSHSGALFREIESSGDLQQLDRLIDSSGGRIRSALGVTPMSESIARLRASSMPADTASAQLYAEAIDLQRRGMSDQSRQKLRELTERYPDFVPGWLQRATAEADANLNQQAAITAQAGLAHAVTATRELRLSLEAISYSASGAWSQSIDSYQTLSRFSPDQPEYALRLMMVQVYAGRKDDAEQTLRTLREPPGMADDVLILQGEYTLAQRLSDDARARDVATRLIERATMIHLPHLHARALAMRGMALTGLRDNDAALADLTQAEREFAPLGDTEWSAKVQLLLGNWAMRGGDLITAEQRYHRAVDGFRAVASRWNENVTLDNLMAIAVARGDAAAARPYVDEVLQSARALGDGLGESRALVYLAWVELDTGHTEAALAAYRQATVLNEHAQQNEQLLASLSYLAELLDDTGQDGEARKVVQHAQSISESVSSTTYKSVVLASVAHGERTRKNPAAARIALDAARTLAEQGQESDRIARIDLAIAELDLDTHQPEAAIERIARAEPILSKSKSTRDLTNAEAIRVRAFCDLEQHDNARNALAASLDYAAKTTGYLDHLPARIAEIRVAVQTGEHAKAGKLQAPLRTELRQRKFVGALAELDAALAPRAPPRR